jgi:curved DNA-binding protein CbpA
MSAFQTLSLTPTASAAEVRTKYKSLALGHHPDKVEPQFRDEATNRFREIQEAYEYCMSHLQTAAEDTSEPEENTDWRGKLPDSIFNANSGWWLGLNGDEPEPVKGWAMACEKALRFASVKLDETDRYILKTEYAHAYDDFENWRRKHMEKFTEEEKLQADIEALPERLRTRARETLNTKRATPGYTQDNYQEDHDEEYYFDEWDDFVTAKTRPNRTYNSSLPPQKRLALFRKQVAALEQRPPIADRTPAEERRRAKRRQETGAMLVQEVERDEELKREAAIKKGLCSPKKKVRKVGPEAEVRATELEEEPVDYDRGLAQRGALPKPASVLDCWEDDCEE